MTKSKMLAAAGKPEAKQKPLTLESDRAKLDAIKKEHRQYLISSGIIDATMHVPPRKKAKKKATTTKQSSSKKLELAGPASTSGSEDDVAASSKAQVAAMTEKSTSKKRKAKELRSGDSSVSVDEPQPNSSTEVTPPPPKKKQKRAASKACDSPTDLTNTLNIKSIAKLKAQSKSKSKSVKTSKDSAKSETPPVPQVHPPTPTPSLTHLDSIILAKINSVKAFASTLTPHTSLLHRNAANHSLISIPELTLHGTLYRMRADYPSFNLDYDLLSDMDDIIVDRFTAPIRQTTDQVWKWVTIDLALPFAFGDGLKRDLADYGAEGLNLLEVELEMFAQLVLEKEKAGKHSTIIFPIDELRTFFDEAWARAQENVKSGVGREVASNGALPLAGRGQFEAELPSLGVCPAPPIEVV